MDAGNLQLLEKLNRVKLQCCLESSFLVFVKLYDISILIAAPPAPDLMYESSLGYTAVEAPSLTKETVSAAPCITKTPDFQDLNANKRVRQRDNLLKRRNVWHNYMHHDREVKQYGESDSPLLYYC